MKNDRIRPYPTTALADRYGTWSNALRSPNLFAICGDLKMKLNDLVKLYGPDARLALRNPDGVTATPLRYTLADEGVFNEDEDVYDLLSQNSLHDLEQKHQTDSLDFFSLVVVDV